MGTVINTVAVFVAGILGLFFGKLLKERHQETLTKVCGITVIFLGLAGALSGMLTVVNNETGTITSGRSMLVVVCLVLGALVGECINIEGGIEKLGEWLKKKTKSDGDTSFVDGFVTSSITICVGAMAILGPMQDALTGDMSTLIVKTILDVIVVFCMTSSLGKGCIFSAIPLFVIQGFFFLFAKVISPVLTDQAINNLSLIGSILIFCVGVNLLLGKKIRVSNLLPAILFAVLVAYLPINI